MTERVRPHPDNTEGPFYVEDGCCTSCGVPEARAPELFGWDGKGHCYVRRQPVTSVETDRALEVVAHAELGCIRYRGLDPDILTRFAELGEPELCDFGARLDLKPVVRDHVVFVDLLAAASTPSDLARLCRDFLLADPNQLYVVTEISSSPEVASFDLAWFENNFHRAEFSRVTGAGQSWLVRHYGNRGVSSALQRWLVADGRFSDVRWHSEQSWRGTGHWRRTPW